MKVIDRTMRLIPRRAYQGWMCIGMIEDTGKTYVLELEPGMIVTGVNKPPVVHIIQYIKMKRSDDILDGDTEKIKNDEEWIAVEKFCRQEGLLTPQRVLGAIRKGAATALSPPSYTHTYECLLSEYKLQEWDNRGRIGKPPLTEVTTHDCWRCPTKWRQSCLAKLNTMYEQGDDTQFTPGELAGLSEEEKDKKK